MEFLKDSLECIKLFFEEYGKTITGIVGLISIAGAIAGGGFHRRKDPEKPEKEEKCNITIQNSKLENSQVAETINNYGLSPAEVKEVASDVVVQETKNKPTVYVQEEEPVDAKPGDIWYKIEE